MATAGRRSTFPLPGAMFWALLFSLAVHLALLFGPRIRVPVSPPAPLPLEVRLLLPPKAPLKAPPREAKPRHKAPRHRARLAQKQEPRPPAPPAQPLAMKSPVTEPSAPQPAPPPAAPPQPAPAPPQPSAAASETPPARAAAPDQADNLPTEAEIQYILYKGTQGLKVGRTVHIWRIRDGRYHVTSVTEASGIFSLFKPGRLVQTSQGTITRDGLVPDAFWIQRGQSADTTDSARFDWEDHLLTLGSYENGRTVALPEHTQDLVSFVYQMGFAGPPKGTLHLHITDGRKLDSYDYRVLGEETLDTPMGSVKALHLSKVHPPGEDGTDIWLGVDYHYLPVKVRLTDKDGDSAEQVIRSIRLNNPPNPLHSVPPPP